jgi:DNA-binding transcriptional LysR family regulator
MLTFAARLSCSNATCGRLAGPDVFHTNGLALPATIVSTYSSVLRHHLVATAGFLTVLPKPTFEIMGKGLSIKTLPVHLPTPRRRVVFVVLKKRTLSSIAQLFIENLRAAARPQTKIRKSASS